MEKYLSLSYEKGIHNSKVAAFIDEEAYNNEKIFPVKI